MGLMDKIKGALGQHGDKVEGGIDRAGDMADERTDGKVRRQGRPGTGLAKDALRKLDDEGDTPADDHRRSLGQRPGRPAGPGVRPSAPSRRNGPHPAGPGAARRRRRRAGASARGRGDDIGVHSGDVLDTIRRLAERGAG